MLLVRHRDREERYYSLAEAARLVSGNQWGVPVKGIHSETLRRSWRDSGGKLGHRIGRDVFFRAQDIEAMGYQVAENPDDYVDLGMVEELIIDEGDDN
jgi:hypothetical protein